jgi:HSP20 family molecular chaperone IbpA
MKNKQKELEVSKSNSVLSPFKSVFDFWPTKWQSFFDFPADPVGVRIGGDDDKISVEIDVPGFKRDEIKVSLTAPKQYIFDSRYSNSEPRKTSRMYSVLNVECKTDNRSAYFSSTVPYTADFTKDPEVKLKEGVLKLTFDRVDETKPKVLEIK